ncbi:MAG: beta strand repeat-containing protein, partial [Ilumatobacteraceae bacterium]
MSKTYGESAFGLTAPSASVAGSFAYASSNTSVLSITGSVATVAGAGTSTITATFTPTDATNYATNTITMTATVAKASQTVSFTSPGDQTYSASTISLTTSASSGLTPTITSSTTGVCTVSGTTLTLVSSGTCTLTSAQAGNDNYNAATSVDQSITVAKATPTVSSMSAQSKTYGDSSFTPTAPTATFESSSVAGSTAYASSNTSVATVNASTGAVVVAGGGSATITATFTPTDTGKVNTATTTYVVTVAKAAQTISFTSPGNQTYSASTISLTTSASSGLTPTITSSTTGVCTVSGTTLTLVSSGTCTLTSAQAGNDNYNAATSVTNSITVSKATPTVASMTGQSKTYGDSSFTPSAPGVTFEGSSVAGSIGYSSSNTSVATVNSSSGAVTITGSGSATITATFTPTDTGKFNAATSTYVVSVGQATPVLSSFANVSKTYGDAAFGFTAPTASVAGSFSYASSDVSVMSVTGSVATVVAPGTATITATFTPTDATNYATNTISMTATVAKAPQSITFTSPGNQTYSGSTVSLSASASSSLSVTITSSTTGVCTVSGTTLTMVANGTCTLTAVQAGNTNYEAATDQTVSITIAQRPITITATAASKQYGASDSAFGYSITSGSLVAGDSLAGALSRATGEDVGSYAMSIGNLTNSKYAITFVPADLTITQRPITVTAATKTKQYGDSDPSFTWSVTTGSLVGSDTLSGGLTRVSGTNVGTYAITRGTLDNTNYDITYVGAQMSITQRPITVTADTLSKQYGDSDPSLTWSVTTGSIVSGDSLSGNLSRVSGESVGTYVVSQGSLANSNYDISYTAANFTITTRPITVTATDRTKVYGESDPSLTWSVTTGSLVGSDNLSGSLTRASGDDAGTYAITRGTLANSNYAITFVDGTLTISTKPITVTADAKSKVYGESDPIFTWSVTSGSLVGSDSLSGALSRATGTSVGTYATTIGTLANANYAITFVPADLTITAKPITVTADDKIITYGDAEPTLTYSTPAGSIVGSDTLSGTLVRTAGTTAGTYTISRGTLANANYTITFVNGTLTINKASQ